MMIRRLSRDRLAVLAAIVVPLAVAAILVPSGPASRTPTRRWP
jgi:hypothetical protein